MGGRALGRSICWLYKQPALLLVYVSEVIPPLAIFPENSNKTLVVQRAKGKEKERWQEKRRQQALEQHSKELQRGLWLLLSSSWFWSPFLLNICSIFWLRYSDSRAAFTMQNWTIFPSWFSYLPLLLFWFSCSSLINFQYFNKKRRKSLIQALDKIKSG